MTSSVLTKADMRLLDPQPSVPTPPDWCISQQEYRAWLEKMWFERELVERCRRRFNNLRVPPKGRER